MLNRNNCAVFDEVLHSNNYMEVGENKQCNYFDENKLTSTKY